MSINLHFDLILFAQEHHVMFSHGGHKHNETTAWEHFEPSENGNKDNIETNVLVSHLY